MRQFVFGLLAAALVWWGYGAFGGSSASSDRGAADGPAGGAPSPGGSTVDRAAESSTGSLAEVLAAKKPSPPPAPTVQPVPVPADLEPLLVAIRGGEEPSIDRGWLMLADPNGLSGPGRRELLLSLLPATEDLAARLQQLGTYNTFLHSAEGRAQAGRVLAAVMAKPDAEALSFGTRLLEISTRGRIERADTAARGFVDEAYGQYRQRVDRWLCDPANVQGAYSHTVARGETLGSIAAKFRKQKVLVEDGTLAILNRIHNPNALQVNQRLKVPADAIRSVLEKRSYALLVYVGDRVLRLYWVGHGEHDKTPVTEFTVAEKQEKPEWTAPDGNRWAYGHPKNILGEYFIKLQHQSYTGFGLHGTPMPETICTMSSMGCVRMLASDIAELFRLLPRGTKLEVRASAATP